ncbi:hypothetical protein ACIBCU_26275 [Streptomyces sp. NPDC051064]|uniref:hypothetical protein n=1 Tax=Streptomyces sp. NPDC051064 TaxID=3365641 RepID=UPI0037886A3D
MDTAPLIIWGRCRSGKRWFWTANEYDGGETHGWADTMTEASQLANAAALQLAAGRYANIHVLHGVATDKLKKLNAAKKATRPPRSARTGAEPPPNPVGYLYGIEPGRWDLNDRTWIDGQIVNFPITKKTARRVYYQRPRGPITHNIWEPGYVDRQELERLGHVRVPHWFMLFAEPPELPETRLRKPRWYQPASSQPDLKALKAAMAAAHPDRGGSNEAFIAARQRYVHAREQRAA